MPVRLVRNDITKIQCDAIVNAANSTLLGGGGVDGAIHRVAGRGLLLECAKLGGCKVGQAKVTGAYKLPCRYVIHTVGPKWRGGENGERELLESCYKESLRLAKEKGCESVAFPLISSGVYGYPKDQALRVAMNVISEFVMDHDMLVYLVLFDKASCQISEKLFSDIQSYIDDNYVELHLEKNNERMMRAERSCLVEEENEEPSPLMPFAEEESSPLVSFAKDEKSGILMPFAEREESNLWVAFEEVDENNDGNDEGKELRAAPPAMASAFPSMAAVSLEDAVKQIDESFSQMLLRKIDEKNMTDAQCYKKANIDRKLFSKIRKDVYYKPSKTTAIAFAIALELPLEETKDMLMKAGFALSHSNKFDIIIEYFIRNGNYNVFEINEALFAFDQSLLG